MQLWPGGGSTLECGFHDICYDDDSQVSWGPALDWSTGGTVSFYSKSVTDSSMFSVAGTAYITVPSQTTCSHVIHASWYDNTSTWHNGASYVHISNSIQDDTSFYINTSQYGYVSTTRALGSTASESGCTAWTGQHVHQESDGSWTLANYPAHSTCNRPNITTECWVSNSYYMGSSIWSVPYP